MSNTNERETMNTFEKMEANIRTALACDFAEGTQFRVHHIENGRRVVSSFSTFAEAYASPLTDSKIRGFNIEIKRPDKKNFQRMTEIKL